MRRHLPAIPALGLALVLAACGGGATATTNPNPAATPGPSSGSVATDAPPPSDPNEPGAGASDGGGTSTGSIADAQDHNDLLAILPTELCGKTPAKFAFSGKSWFQDVDPAAIDELASYGKTVDDAYAAMEVVADETACSAGIVRIKGLTPDQVRSINDKMGGDAQATEVTIDGRQVWQDRSDTGVAYFYTIGDALVMASAADEAHAKEVLALLPKP